MIIAFSAIQINVLKTGIVFAKKAYTFLTEPVVEGIRNAIQHSPYKSISKLSMMPTGGNCQMFLTCTRKSALTCWDVLICYKRALPFLEDEL